jgi:cyclophilin family peptidyl-prolyl cis-trans isomerase
MERNSSRTVWVSIAVWSLPLIALGSGCGHGTSDTAAVAKAPSAAAPTSTPKPHDVAVLEVKGFGTIRFELLADKAPKTVENFEKLADSGFYDGTTFHRVVPGFVIQGGDPNSKNADPRDDGQGGPGYTIDAEFNDTAHVRGVVSMARGPSPNSAGSQFFILVADSPQLDGQYTAFGRVIDGMEVGDKIVDVPRDEFGRHGPPDRPLENVVIEHARIEHPAPLRTGSAPGPEASADSSNAKTVPPTESESASPSSPPN